MRFGLVLTAEVEVNIRHLIPLEPQKDFKGDVKTVFYHRLPAAWTILIRQVKTSFAQAIYIKIRDMAGFATVVRRQGVYLCNAAHGGDK